MMAKRKPMGKRKANSRVKSPRPLPKRFLGHALPGVKPGELTGRLIVIEGADGSLLRPDAADRPGASEAGYKAVSRVVETWLESLLDQP